MRGTNELRRVGAALALGYIAAELEASGDGPRSSSSSPPPPPLAEVGAAVAAAVAELAAPSTFPTHPRRRRPALGAAGWRRRPSTTAPRPPPLPRRRRRHDGRGGCAEDADEVGCARTAEVEVPAASKVGVVRHLVKLLGGTKTREAVESLGRIGAGEPHGVFRNDLLTALFGPAKEKM